MEGATSYKLFYSTDGSVSTASPFLSTANTTFTHETLTGGITYRYRVAAVVNGNLGSLSNEVAGIPLIGQLPIPSISPSSGYYSGSTATVSMSSSISGTTIYFTTDGTAPDCSGASGTPYSTPLTISSFKSYRVIACHSNYTDSPEANAEIAVNPPVCGNYGNSCYDNIEALSVKFAQISGTSTIIEYVKADLTCTEIDCFMVWKERGGERLLNATGIWIAGISEWQKKLNRSGIGFSGNHQHLTQRQSLAGRVCPTHVFLNRTDMTSTNQCMYYDSGNTAQALNRDSITAGSINSEDFLIDWTATASGKGSLSSWYEGNVKVCADKGMRLPTIYETSANRPSTSMPSDASVSFAGPNRGVPSMEGDTWTATPNTIYGTSNKYFSWNTASTVGTSFSANTPLVRCVLPSDPLPFCGESGNGCYNNSTVTSTGKAYVGGSIEIEYVPTGNGFNIWREKNGSRVLKATGLWFSQSDWQQMLNRAGTEFQSVNLTDISQIGGRSCPPNVFLNHGAMTESHLCLYYDAGNTYQWLNRDKTGGVIAQDYLEYFTLSGSGRGTDSSWYEGNIKACADKGMRLPTLYEMGVSDPGSSITKPTDANPTFSTSAGVPAYNRSWTASATPGTSCLEWCYWQTVGTSSYSSHFQYYNAYSYQAYVRCVLPPSQIALNITSQPISVISQDGTAAFSVAVSSSSGTTLSYQWQRSSDNGATFNDIQSANSPSLSLSNLNDTDHLTRYRVVVSASNPTLTENKKTSSAATLRLASSMTICGDEAGNGCYDNVAAIAAKEALLKDITLIQHVKADPTCSGSNCFMVWKDAANTRILPANGMWNSSGDWQKKLARSGDSYSSTLLTDYTKLVGRACPTNVFINTSNKTATGQCLYYDAGNPDQSLSTSGGIESEDYMSLWNRTNTGNGVNSSWYEGNIKVCADKGMRLPTLYETTASAPALDKPADANPTFGGTRVPNHTGPTWTASANMQSSSRFFTWTSATSSSMSTSSYLGPIYVRCVLP